MEATVGGTALAKKLLDLTKVDQGDGPIRPGAALENEQQEGW